MGSNIHLTRLDGGIVTFQFDRPPANALDLGFLNEINGLLAELAVDASVSAIVLTGTGDIYSAGMDLTWVPTLDREEQTLTVQALNRTFTCIYSFPKPTIAAINGHAIAGGLFFVLGADYCISRRDRARFGLTEVRVGALYPVAAIEIARAELAPPVARRLLLGGNTIDAHEARSVGILDEIVAAGQVLERAIAVARQYVDIPAQSYAAVKQQLRGPIVARITQVVEDGCDPTLGRWLVGDVAASVRSVMAKSD